MSSCTYHPPPTPRSEDRPLPSLPNTHPKTSTGGVGGSSHGGGAVASSLLPAALRKQAEASRAMHNVHGWMDGRINGWMHWWMGLCVRVVGGFYPFFKGCLLPPSLPPSLPSSLTHPSLFSPPHRGAFCRERTPSSGSARRPRCCGASGTPAPPRGRGIWMDIGVDGLMCVVLCQYGCVVAVVSSPHPDPTPSTE